MIERRYLLGGTRARRRARSAAPMLFAKHRAAPEGQGLAGTLTDANGASG